MIEELTVIGRESCVDVVKGFNNVVIGDRSTSGKYSNCVLIGNNLKATEDNQVIIGNTINAVVEEEVMKEALEYIHIGLRMLIDRGTGNG